MKTRFLSLAGALVAILFISAPASSLAQGPVEEVHMQVVAFNDAYLRNDLETYFGFYAEDASLWFNSGRVTLTDYRRDWYELISDGGGVEKNVISDLQVQVGPGDVSAVATYQLDVLTRMPDGSVTTDHAHETDVWFKRDGKWLVEHVHYTVEAPE